MSSPRKTQITSLSSPKKKIKLRQNNFNFQWIEPNISTMEKSFKPLKIQEKWK